MIGSLPMSMNVRSRSRPYDSGESRRSPRERSPAPQRYNDSRDSGPQRGPAYRGNDVPSRPSADPRSSSDIFSSNRDNFREMSRQVPRDHTIGLAPPRAPRAFNEAPTGPRAIIFAADSSGRGGGRGRGRGWLDEGRERGSEYDYRDRRDGRGGGPFRADRGRDREWVDDRRDRDGLGFRGRRPSSPGSGYVRGRGRTRGEWETRGYGRGYDERDRFRGRSRSPPPPSRRASVVSPPPQAPEVPAFGSVINHPPASSGIIDNQHVPPATSVTIPTGPRSTRDLSVQKSWTNNPNRLPSLGSVEWRQPPATQAPQAPETPHKSSTKSTTMTDSVVQKTSETSQKLSTKSTAMKDLVVQKSIDSPQIPLILSTSSSTPAYSRLPLLRDDVFEDDDEDSESGEDMDDFFFEAETKKIQDQLAQTSLGNVERSFTYASQNPVALFPLLEPAEKMSDDGNEVDRREMPPLLSPLPQRSTVPAYPSDGDESDPEYQEQLAAVRPRMMTPPISSLPFPPLKKKWYENDNIYQEIEEAAEHQAILEKEMAVEWRKDDEYKENLCQEYKRHYKNYLQFCESDDFAAVNYRARLAANEKAASRAASLTPAAEGRPEGRRAGSRFATEHDIARVIQESKREAQEKQERSERAAKAKAASEKEAIIPDMMSLEEYRKQNIKDTSRLVPFDRAPAILGILPPIDNFTLEECEIFEKTYLDFPKQWTKIAAALPGRDYKNCIQHYYIVKHKDNLKEKLRKKEKGKKKGRASAAASKPKSNALMANLGSRDGETDDGQDAVDGERRRPRRAAAPIWPFEAPSESENATPVPTPGRRMGSTNKGDTGSESGPTKRKNKSSARDKGPKQPKNGQLLAAAPASKTRDPDENIPSAQVAEKPPGKLTSEPNRFLSQFDGTSQSPAPYLTSRAPHELVAGPPTVMADKVFHSYPDSEYGESSSIGLAFDSQHNDRRNTNPTSSYWSVPEQTDFPGLLQHFGTDWHAIAKFMASKTHIMVKNYYQRQIDSGRQDLEDIAGNADARKARGESTGPPPTPTVPVKRRYDGPGGVVQRSAMPTMETAEDLPIGHQPIGMQSSPKSSTRFPALAQAGPVPQTTQPPRTISTSKPVQTQPQPPQWVPQVLQQQHQRGPQLGYFTPDRERPTLQPASTQPSVGLSDPLRRSEIAAKEAEWERDNAMRLQQQQVREQQAREQQAREQQAREQQAREQQAREQQAREQQAREQQARQQQQQHRQRLGEQQGRRQQQTLKSETDLQNMSQFEQYSTQGQQPNIVARPRIEEPSSMYVGEMRRGPSIYTPRDTQAVRDIGSDKVNSGSSGLMSNPVSQLPRATTTAPHVHPEAPVAQRPQPPTMTAVRQQETVRKTSSIMSLLNNDEPTDQRILPIKRNSDGPPAPVQPSPSPAAQQPLYPPARSLSGGQPGQMRRKASIGDLQGLGHSYSRSAAPTQGPMRVVESPYSAAVQSHQAQSRSQTGSTMDTQPVSERDGYTHQQQYGMQRQQQPSANPQQYQPGQPAHRQQMAFASSTKRPASPPGQYQPLQASRNNSFEFSPAQVHYGPGPTGPPTTMAFQSTPQAPHPLSAVRYQPSYTPSYEVRESYRPAPPVHNAVVEQQRHQLLLQQQEEEMNQQRRLDGQRRYEDFRRQ